MAGFELGGIQAEPDRHLPGVSVGRSVCLRAGTSVAEYLPTPKDGRENLRPHPEVMRNFSCPEGTPPCDLWPVGGRGRIRNPDPAR